MKNRPRSFSRLVPLLVALAAITPASSWAVGSAGATTATSPPIEPQLPSENAVQASGEPLSVTFTCPSFVAEEGEVIEETEEE